MNDIRFASRKFILAAFLLVAAIALRIAGLIDQGTWSTFSTWVLGLYVTGNVGTEYVAGITGTTNLGEFKPQRVGS